VKSFKTDYKSGKGIDQPDKSTPAHSAKDDSEETDHIGDTMVGNISGPDHHGQSGRLVGEDKDDVPYDGDHEYRQSSAKD